MPTNALAHADIYFPKFFTPSELQNSGFVLLNLDPRIATVNFYLFSPSGGVLARPDAFQIQAGCQFSRLGSELFPNAASGGWVAAITDSDTTMQAFWMNYDSNITFLDGAEAQQFATTGPDQIIPLVAGDTELNIVGLSGITATATIRLYGDDRELAPAITRPIPTFGVVQTKVSAIFPSVDMTQARYIRVRTPGAPIASTAVIRNFQVPFESAVVNGVNADTRTALTFPHVVNGLLTDANYTTTIGVSNLSNSSQTVTLTFNIDGGSPITVTRNLGGAGALRETAVSLFGLSTEFVTGWVRVTGTSPITGFAAYADTVGGALAVVPAGTAETNLFFSHIADGPPKWQTGLALLNGNDAVAAVSIYAINPSGSLIGSTTLAIEPGQKVAKVIHELIPETRGVNAGFIYIRSTANVPIYGVALFYTEDLNVLSNVAAGKFNGAPVYTPPAQ